MDANTLGVVIELIFESVEGLILSWSVGLAPALIYRYAIFKRPIENKKVFWRLAPVIVVLMFAFKLTMAALSGTQPNPNPIPWVIIYFIGKWIMTRKPNPKSASTPLPTPAHAASAAASPPPPKATLQQQAEPPTQPPQMASQPVAVARPKRRMHGCLLAFLIALALLVIGLPLGLYIAGKAFMDYVEEKMESSPLYVAVAAGDLDQVDLLLSQGEDPDQKGPMGHSPLIMAARKDYSLIAERLLKAGANPNQKDSLQWAPLHHAVKTDKANLDTIAILVRYGADVNVTDSHLRTALHRAAQFGHVDAVRLLLRLGANPNAKDDNGWTPLDRGAAHPAVREELGGQ
jgi:ankyrin repeat protein